jgi:hypothetical protein
MGKPDVGALQRSHRSIGGGSPSFEHALGKSNRIALERESDSDEQVSAVFFPRCELEVDMGMA